MGNHQARIFRNPLSGRGYWFSLGLLCCMLIGAFDKPLVARCLSGDPEPAATGVADKSGDGATEKKAATFSPRQVAQCRLLREMAGELDKPQEQAMALLTAAECSLERECAEPISVIWAGRAEGRMEAARYLSLFAKQAKEDLARAGELLSRSDVAEGDAADMIEQDRERAETMQAFAVMFDAIGAAVSAEGAATTQPASDDPVRNKLISACHGLAPCLDVANEGVVDAARFYQGLAYRLAGRPERTLIVIKPILAKPRFPRLGLMSRLEYCRAMGLQGEHAAALVVCMRLGKLSEEWFSDEPAKAQAAARATVLAVRIELMQQWATSLDAAGQKEDADEIREQTRELIKKQGKTDSKPALLELEKAVP